MPNIPASMNLGQLPTAIPSIMYKEPKEGHKSVAYDIDWARAIARGVDTVFINMQDGGTLEFSQICGLIVDNSNCGSDLDFIFPDTDVVISIPAYAPYTCLQINTQQVQLYVRALQPLAVDRTDFMVLNYAPMPVAVPITRQQQIASIENETLDGVSITDIVLPGVSGTIQNLQLNVAFPQPSVSFNNLLEIIDGDGSVVWAGNVAAQDTSDGLTTALAALNGVSIRFNNGIRLRQIGGFAPGGTLNVIVYYLTP